MVSNKRNEENEVKACGQADKESGSGRADGIQTERQVRDRQNTIRKTSDECADRESKRDGKAI
jgi:hypothetical protein